MERDKPAAALPVSAPAPTREIVLAGAAAGVLAALAMIVFMAAAAALDGGDALGPLRAVGSTFRGEGALAGPVTVAWGVLLHLAVGAVLGVLFSAVVPGDHTLASAMVLGAGCGLVVMSFAVALLVPRVSPTLSAALPHHGGAWVVAHALFGAVLGIAPSLRRWLHAARRRPEHLPLRPRTSP